MKMDLTHRKPTQSVLLFLTMVAFLALLPATSGLAQDPAAVGPNPEQKQAPSFEPSTMTGDFKSAIVIDAETGLVLVAANAQVRRQPASMLKMMTELIVLEHIADGDLKMDDIVTVSARSSKMGGSQVYLKHGETFAVEELLKALAIHSANDAAVALAEQLTDGIDDDSLLDRVVGSDRVSVHRSATAPEDAMRDRAIRLLEVGHGMRPRIQSDGVIVATKRRDFIGKLVKTVRDAQGLGQLGKLRRVEIAAVDVGDEPGALVLSADITDQRNAAVAGGAAVGVVGGVVVASAAVALGPIAILATPVAIAAGVLTSRAVHGTAERDVREHLEEAADALVRGDEPDGMISRSARKALESLRRGGRKR